MNTTVPVSIRADHEIRELLTSLAGVPHEASQVDDHAAADLLLARAVWSRLTEPGDGLAGVLVAALGPLTALDLVASGASPHAIRAEALTHGTDEMLPTPNELATALQRWRPRLDRDATVNDLRVAASARMTLLTPEHADWPERLADLGVHMPHALWVRGNPRALARAGLAVVGARACTSYGSQVTAEFTSLACAAGFTIISGAAYGVDAVAHRTALAADQQTVAVLAGGAERPYPAAHDQLIDRIADQGAVCSEVVPGTAPTRWRFLQRNRLISALAQAVLVTEAGVRSGTLNTAGHPARV